MLAAYGLAAVLALAAAASMWLGGPRERRGVALLAVVSAASIVLPQHLTVRESAWVLFALDGAVLLSFGALAWKAPGAWPIWVMAPQGVAAAASLAFLLQADAGEQTYLRALMMARYTAALLLLIGASRRTAAHP